MPLLFKRRFFDAIRAGRKTQTIRLWRRAMVRAGRLVAVPYLAGGRLLIESVEPIADLADLTEDEAQADGFASLADLLACLAETYPELAGGRPKVGRRRANTGGAAGRHHAKSAEPVSRKLFRVRFRFVADRAAAP